MLRPTKLRYYIAAMEARGYAAEAVLANSGIAPDRLYDPMLLIDAHQCDTVIQNMVRLTDNSALGFDIGREARLTDFGILAHAMMSSKTLRQAIHLWLRFYHLAGMTIQVKIEETRTGWITYVDTGRAQGITQHFCVEEILIIGLTLGKYLSDLSYTPIECDIAYPAPPHANRYQELFGCPVRFNARATRLEIGSPSLDTELRGHDPESNEICLHHCNQIMRQITRNRSVAAQLRSLFLGCSGNIPSLEEAASQIGLSSRTLRRQLENENTGYQMLVNDFRMGLAQEHLRSQHLTPKEIGFLLGYSNITAFRRAFRSWTGKTIQQFRRDTAERLQEV